MTTAHPAGTPSPSGGTTGEPQGDPSMDDILASIRRILSEDEGQAAAKSGSASVHADMAADDVFMLDASMIVDEPGSGSPPLSPTVTVPHVTPAATPAPPYFAPSSPAMAAPEPAVPVPVLAAPILSASVLNAAVPAVEPVVPPASEPAAEMPRKPATADDLVAPEAAALAATSVGSLLRHLQVERQAAVHRGGPTIEELVREEMRPILKQWLDAYLPPLVERLVRAEIERVVARSVS